MLLWSLSPRFLLVTPLLCVRNSIVRTSSSARSSCVNPGHFMIICILLVSSLVLISMTSVWWRPLMSLLAYCRKARLRKTSTHCLWASPRQKQLNCLLTPILHCAWLTSTSWTPTRRASV